MTRSIIINKIPTNSVKKNVKFGPVDPEIIGLQSKKKFLQENNIARRTNLPGGLNQKCVVKPNMSPPGSLP